MSQTQPRLHLHLVPFEDVTVKTNRQRREFDEAKILELAGSISENGLIHPVVLRATEEDDWVLVAGWRRTKALEHLWFLKTEVRCNGHVIPEGFIPATFLGEIDPIDAEEIELEENIRREDLHWKDRADATARLAALRAAKAARNNLPPPSVAAIAEEVTGSSEGQFQENTRQDIILGRALQDPTRAAAISGATSRKEAFKLLKRHEESQKNATLAASLGPQFTAKVHTLLQADSLSHMPLMPESTFDIVLTDPIYGIGADEFSDSGGKAAGGHFYDDSYELWLTHARALAEHSFRLTKAEAHAYVFCDVDRFGELKAFFGRAGWRVFRTPLIWVNPGAVRAPWPEHGPQRKYQCILFAIKGDRKITRIYGDVLTYPSDPNLGHPAQKPVALLADLLLRSARPGDAVLDPFCGSGSTFVAGHQHKCRVTGIELNPSAAGIAAKRIQELKP
jgi:DNA modification methylase